MGVKELEVGKWPGLWSRRWDRAERGVPGASPVSLKQRLPLELGRHHQNSKAGRATVGSRVLDFLRCRMVWSVKPTPQEHFSPRWANLDRSTHHVLCLQVSPQLLPEVFGAEFHCGSPAGAAAQRGWNPTSHPGHTASALPDATSAEASTSALTKASVNPALPPSSRPSFPTVLDFRVYHQPANQSQSKDGIGR